MNGAANSPGVWRKPRFPGEEVSLIGPSGGGTSTLPNIGSGLYLPSEGEVHVSGKRVTTPTLGLLQYLSPTLQLLLGVWVFGESLAGDPLVGLVLIWMALAIYSAEGSWHTRRRA